MTSHSSTEIQVWDRFVRIAHWTVAIGFLVAYLTEGAMLVHVWAGYVIGILVVLRIVWGFVGPSYARFADFVYNPATVLAYSWDLRRLGGGRYWGTARPEGQW